MSVGTSFLDDPVGEVNPRALDGRWASSYAHRPRQYYVGISIQCFLIPTSSVKSYKTSARFRKAVTARYHRFIEKCPHTAVQPWMHFEGEPIPADEHGPLNWLLDDCFTIGKWEGDDLAWPVQFSSPAFATDYSSQWAERVEFLFKFIDEHYTIRTTGDCNTLVRVSGQGGFDLASLKKIAQTTIWFEGAVESLLPRQGMGDSLAKRNYRDNTSFSRGTITKKASIDLVRGCATLEDLIEVMCPLGDTSYQWNFGDVLSEFGRTVEFRRGSQSDCPEDIFRWVEFTTAFVYAAMQSGKPEQLAEFEDSVYNLLIFINRAKIKQMLPPGLTSMRRLLSFLAAGLASSASESRAVHAAQEPVDTTMEGV